MHLSKLKWLRKFFFILSLSLLTLLLVISITLYFQTRTNYTIINDSNYNLYIKNILNKPSYYPAKQTISSSLYQPVSSWTGRLILPPKEQREVGDVVLFEVHNADSAHQNIVGKIVNLQWIPTPEAQQYVQAVTRDVSFTKETEDSKKQNNLHPDRLNNLKSVGPLESLAGARPEDDVIVMLPEPVLFSSGAANRTSLVISKTPVQITGRFYALVTVIESKDSNSDRFLVRHYNKTSKNFDGLEEIIRIPQVTPDRVGIRRATNRTIEKSPLNPYGWYIYGAKDTEGVFVAQAIEPRAIMRIEPDDVRFGLKQSLDYINKEVWKDTAKQKGTAKTVLLSQNANQRNEALTQWREGDKAIVIHSYGGIGGDKPEPSPLGVVTGHFSYGIATVVRDKLTDELRFDIEYRQVYAHNPDGIVAGAIKWSSYMGDLQRGWLGNRPVADVIIKLDAISEDYDFDGIKLSPIAEFTKQLDIMTARYRIGDGTGAALVTPSTSCVQDSNQALYVTIKKIEETVQTNPSIQEWFRRNPNNPQKLRFQKLVQLGRSLEKQLAPLRIIRSDWKNNAGNLAGTRTPDGLMATLLKSATTWRTMLPRRAQDEITSIFLSNGASLWIIRTNQVGGFDPTIKPVAPTALLGHRTN
jgi:predicted Abi (CAAX) family protease